MKTIEVIMIHVEDQQKAKEFYAKLGFELMVEAPMGNGETWVQVGLPNQTTSLALTRFPGIILETEDIEKEIGELNAKGIEVSKVDNTPWGKFVQLKDVDGNPLTLHQK
jgi:catechol 2,3-dioxygenase-like lactoylglutathione lyase family enzyme